VPVPDSGDRRLDAHAGPDRGLGPAGPRHHRPHRCAGRPAGAGADGLPSSAAPVESRPGTARRRPRGPGRPGCRSYGLVSRSRRPRWLGGLRRARGGRRAGARRRPAAAEPPPDDHDHHGQRGLRSNTASRPSRRLHRDRRGRAGAGLLLAAGVGGVAVARTRRRPAVEGGTCGPDPASRAPPRSRRSPPRVTGHAARRRHGRRRAAGRGSRVRGPRGRDHRGPPHVEEAQPTLPPEGSPCRRLLRRARHRPRVTWTCGSCAGTAERGDQPPTLTPPTGSTLRRPGRQREQADNTLYLRPTRRGPASTASTR
jgi:hypothetical protein